MTEYRPFGQLDSKIRTVFAKGYAWLAGIRQDGLIPYRERSDLDQATDLVIASQLSKRMPLVYGIAVVNVLLISNAYYGTVSVLHLAAVTIPLLLVAVIRAMYWRPHAVYRRPAAKISRDLQLLPFSGAAVASGLMVFGLSLYPFGDSEQQSLIHYIATLTSFIAILGLNPSPNTASGMTAVAVFPSVATFTYFEHENALAICVTMVSVSALLLLISRRQYDGLIELIQSKAQLQQRELEASRLADRLHHQAYFDELTAIPNRRAFFEKFEAQLSASTMRPWLALLDLNDFKSINDLNGHGAGDEVLRIVAERIRGMAGVDYCGRLGGDEFAVILPEELPQESVVKLAGELARAIAQPIRHESQILSVRCSIGLRKTEGLSVSDGIERADWALYKAKRNRTIVECFSSNDEAKMEERSRIAKLFDAADLSHELEVVYQPITNFNTGEIHALEVLARWNCEGGSVIMPDVFIPMAESSRRSNELTRVMIEKSLRELPASCRGLSIHINLSVLDITDAEFVDWLENSDAFDNVPRSQIVLELTETAMLTGGNRAARNLERLRTSRFRVALDDFGVGQSSLSRIHQLPLDEIKIDKAFCSEDSSNKHGWAIIATILALSRQIGLECVLEGIETEQQALRARALGFRMLQGYYFSKPLKARQLEDYNFNHGFANGDSFEPLKSIAQR